MQIYFMKAPSYIFKDLGNRGSLLLELKCLLPSLRGREEIISVRIYDSLALLLGCQTGCGTAVDGESG